MVPWAGTHRLSGYVSEHEKLLEHSKQKSQLLERENHLIKVLKIHKDYRHMRPYMHNAQYKERYKNIYYIRQIHKKKKN